MKLPWQLTKLLRDKMYALMGRRPADVNIGPAFDPYMQRWFVIPRNRVLNIYLHKFRHDDDRTLHSHPWFSVSVLLSGELAEHSTATAEGAADPLKHLFRRIRLGDIVFRSAHMFHRIEVQSGHAVTLFITGPDFKTWHFACPKGLVHWKKFVADRDDNVSAPGAGCGETD